jgi:hypothetical protein
MDSFLYWIRFFMTSFHLTFSHKINSQSIIIHRDTEIKTIFHKNSASNLALVTQCYTVLSYYFSSFLIKQNVILNKCKVNKNIWLRKDSVQLFYLLYSGWFGYVYLDSLWYSWIVSVPELPMLVVLRKKSHCWTC